MRRSLSALAAAAALTIAAAGCGGGSSTSATSGSGATAGTTTPTSGSTSTTTPSGGRSAGSGTSGPSAGPSGSGSTTTPTSSGDNSIQTYGSEAQGTDKAAVVAAMRSFMRAVAAPDYAKVCAEISNENRQALGQFLKSPHFKGKSCATLLSTLLHSQIAPARKAANGTITGVRIKGPHAFVLFRPAAGPPSYFVMLKEAGGWKATSLAPGIPLNPTLPGR